MKILFELLDKLRKQFKTIFVAEESDPTLVRKKQVRLGIAVGILFVLVCCFIFTTGVSLENKIAEKKEVSENRSKIEISELAKGVENESKWVNEAGKEVEGIKQKQIENEDAQGKFKEYVKQKMVSREELGEYLKKLESELEGKYRHLFEEEIGKLKGGAENKTLENVIEAKSFFRKKKIKKVGEYIPAGSYAEAKMISGVDAGVGMSAEADPRHVLLRITGELTSAGYGAEYIKSNKLIGCLLQCQATGDISSEKAYLKAVIMTCARDKGTVVEVPVKGYVSSKGKVGIRGEVVSREGDMVLSSFLSGLTSGFGSGVAQYSQPQATLFGGLPVTGEDTAKKIGMRGLGAGLSSSGDRLSDYFIKRAEQYQPVISINEGTEVHVVFQEGFSLKEGEDEKDGK